MKALAFVLVLGAFIRHDAANWFASVSGMKPAAIFYVLGGMWEATLCLLILWMMADYPESMWRNLAAGGALIGFLEAFQMAGCRLSITDIKAVPPGVNLCDFVTGVPIGAVMTSLYVVMLAYYVGRAIRGRSA